MLLETIDALILLKLLIRGSDTLLLLNTPLLLNLTALELLRYGQPGGGWLNSDSRSATNVLYLSAVYIGSTETFGIILFVSNP